MTGASIGEKAVISLADVLEVTTDYLLYDRADDWTDFSEILVDESLRCFCSSKRLDSATQGELLQIAMQFNPRPITVREWAVAYATLSTLRATPRALG